MAKRFTDTDKWKDDWYISLSNDYKIIWQWLLDNCNHAGICKRSINSLNKMCDTNITEDELLTIMEGRIIPCSGHWFIPNFLKFQYSTFFSNKPAVISVVNELVKTKCYTMIPQSFGIHYIITQELITAIKNKDKYIKDLITNEIYNYKIIVQESLNNHSLMIKDTDKDTDKVIKNKKDEVENSEHISDVVKNSDDAIDKLNEIVLKKRADNSDDIEEEIEIARHEERKKIAKEHKIFIDAVWTHEDLRPFINRPFAARKKLFREINKESEYVRFQKFSAIVLDKHVNLLRCLSLVTFKQFKEDLINYSDDILANAIASTSGAGEHVHANTSLVVKIKKHAEILINNSQSNQKSTVNTTLSQQNTTEAISSTIPEFVPLHKA